MNLFQMILQQNPNRRTAARKFRKLIYNTPPSDLMVSFCELSVSQQLQLISMLNQDEKDLAFLMELTTARLPQRLLEEETKEQLAALIKNITVLTNKKKFCSHEELDRLISKAGRPCSLALTTPLTTPLPPLKTSRLLGGSALMLPHEQWPRSGGEPMTCILNICIAELPFVPEIFKGSSWIVLYTDVNGGYLDETGWVIREYPSMEGLIERKAPALQEKASNWTPLHLSWVEYQDMLDPGSDDTSVLGAWEAEWKASEIIDYQPGYRINNASYGSEGHLLPKSRHAPRTKIGGFPTMKQCETENGPSHPKYFLLQIFYDISPSGGPIDDISLYFSRRYDLCDCAITYVGLDDNCNWIVETQTS